MCNIGFLESTKIFCVFPVQKWLQDSIKDKMKPYGTKIT